MIRQELRTEPRLDLQQRLGTFYHAQQDLIHACVIAGMVEFPLRATPDLRREIYERVVEGYALAIVTPQIMLEYDEARRYVAALVEGRPLIGPVDNGVITISRAAYETYCASVSQYRPFSPTVPENRDHGGQFIAAFQLEERLIPPYLFKHLVTLVPQDPRFVAPLKSVFGVSMGRKKDFPLKNVAVCASLRLEDILNLAEQHASAA
ncbi:MAG TPA: hypothetical protein VJH22_01750 [Candidatus Nanoarchaeia archaeon]|nr:hypothetical protein [Candidatus Nanoarchaeia archaeon]